LLYFNLLLRYVDQGAAPPLYILSALADICTTERIVNCSSIERADYQN